MPSSDYKRSLMYRIYIVFLARKVLCPRGLSVSWLLLSSLGLFWFVSILNVVRNFWAATSDFGSAYGFVAHSVTHTTLLVQSIMVGILAVGAFFAFDMYRNYLSAR